MADERDFEGINNRVKIHEVCKLPPFSDDSAATTKTTTTAAAAFATLSLTYFDTYWIRFGSWDNLLFYEIRGLTWDSFSKVVLPKLKLSLSLTLLHYLPLAGHLVWPPHAEKPAVCYSFPHNYSKNDGVSVTVAESNADFDLLAGNGIRKAVDFYPLVPRLSTSDDKAEVIAIQITLFPNHGFSICISIDHAVLDGASFMLFMKSWAYLCKQLDLHQQNKPPSLPERLTPCFDRTLIKDPDGIDLVYVKHNMAFAGLDPNTRNLKPNPVDPKVADTNNLVRRTFELSSEDLNKLKHKLLLAKEQHQSKSKQLHLSSYVLTCAHVYACMVKAITEDANTTVVFSFNADCRSRLDPPLPVNYFGNCVSAAVCVVAKASDFLRGNGIDFVEKLSDSIKGLRGDAIVGSEDKIVRKYEMLKQMGEQSIMLRISGSHRFDFYGPDFGWGKPKKVEPVSIDRSGAICLTENKDGGGVEVAVVLEKQKMEVFSSLFIDGLNDEHIISTVPRSRI